MTERDRPVLEHFAEALKEAFGDAIQVDAQTTLSIRIGLREARFNRDGELVGVANSGTEPMCPQPWSK